MEVGLGVRLPDQRGEGQPRALVGRDLRQLSQRLVRRADVGRPVHLAPLALGVRLHVREQARSVVVQVVHPALAVESIHAWRKPRDVPGAEHLAQHAAVLARRGRCGVSLNATIHVMR